MKSYLFKILLLVLILTIELFAQNLTITPHGATNEVSGSLTEVEYNNFKILIDCGAYYPEGNPKIPIDERENISNKKNQELPIDANSINALLLTHAHLDHSGRIPLLVKSGFKGTIYVTPGTKKLIQTMLIMQIRYDNSPRDWVFSKKSIKKYDNEVTSAKGHWNNCKWQQKIAYSNRIRISGKRKNIEKNNNYSIDKISPCKVCAQIEYNPIEKQIKEIPFNKKIQLNKNISFEFIRTEHIPGAAAILLTVKENNKTKKILFSGDVGNDLEILYPKPKVFPKADIVFIESTYGNIVRGKSVYSEEEKFKKDLEKALKNNKLIWIPAFALDRTQKMLLMIKDVFKNNSKYKNTSVYCPSPSANKITKIYKEELKNQKNNWFKSSIYSKYKKSNLFANYSRKLPKEIERPSIIITTSGMMESAFSETLLKELNNKSTSVFIVGYQDPGTPGGIIKSGEKILSWHDKKYSVNSTIYNYKCFSSHVDFKGSLKVLSKQDKNSVKIYLNHGEKSAIENKRESLKSNGYKNVFVAENGKEIRINIR